MFAERMPERTGAVLETEAQVRRCGTATDVYWVHTAFCKRLVGVHTDRVSAHCRFRGDPYPHPRYRGSRNRLAICPPGTRPVRAGAPTLPQGVWLRSQARGRSPGSGGIKNGEAGEGGQV